MQRPTTRSRIVAIVQGGACLLLGLALGALPTAGQQEMEDVQIETTKVADGLYMLVGRGGNIGLSVGPDGAVLIDDQFAPLSDKIRAAVKKVTEQPIRFVLNTHWHGDHTGGNEKLAQAGALIVAHDNVRLRMSVAQLNTFFNNRTPASPPGALPVVTYNDGATLHVNGEDIEAYHVPPAHTDGDSVVRFPAANVAHLGDVFFNGSYPFIDLSSGGSVDGVISAVEAALKWVDDDTKLIPGHGPLGGRADLVAYRDMLLAVRTKVAALIAAGKSLDEIRAAKPSADYDEKWGQGFINPDAFIGLVFQSLKK